jgi:hypothetical protein
MNKPTWCPFCLSNGRAIRFGECPYHVGFPYEISEDEGFPAQVAVMDSSSARRSYLDWDYYYHSELVKPLTLGTTRPREVLMAHWHDFNPWAAHLIYVPDLEEFIDAVGYSEDKRRELLKYWQSAGKIDCYVLPSLKLAHGHHEMGIRYGKEGQEYSSPYGNHDKLQKLIDKYGPKGGVS